MSELLADIIRDQCPHLSAEQAVACATGENDTVTGTPAPNTAELELLAAAVVLLATGVVVVAGRAVVATAAEVV